MISILIFLNLLCQPKFDIEFANRLTINQEYEKSIFVLQQLKPTATTDKEYFYLMAANYFALNNKKDSSYWIAKYSDSFNVSTRRYDTLIYIMEQNLNLWKDGDLADIERDMRKSVARLEIAKAGVETQNIQKEIVNKLDKLIKKEEDKNKKDQDSASNSLPIPGSNPQPQEDSIIGGGSGAGKVDEKKLRQYAEEWGGLPPARRAAILKEIEQSVPKKYKLCIEEYLKSLSRVKK